ncbi:MAG: DUF1801 domain-containing protein [Bacteroidia bacterium]
MLALRDIILNIDQEIKTAWKYGMPFFVLDGKMLCYLWKDKKTGKPYIGFADGKLMDHPQLEQGNRSRMKVLHIDPEQDIDVELVEELVKMGMAIKGF